MCSMQGHGRDLSAWPAADPACPSQTWGLQGWLGNRDTVLHSGDGPISCVRWAGSLIAWTSPAGTKVRSMPLPDHSSMEGDVTALGMLGSRSQPQLLWVCIGCDNTVWC